MKIKSITYYIILLLVSLNILSCSDDQCNADTESLFRTQVLVKSTELKNIKYLDSLSVYSPEWEDSIHYSEEGVTTETSLYFMLSPTNDTTEIIFTSKQAEFNDTLHIYSQRKFTYLSPECGFIVYFTIDTILFTDNYIDSLELIKSEISVTQNGHVKIYF